MKIYLASSWRNQRQPAVLAALRAAGHEVYDFRNPAPGDNGFAWSGEPELMYKMCDLITDSLDVAVRRLRIWDEQKNAAEKTLK